MAALYYFQTFLFDTVFQLIFFRADELVKRVFSLEFFPRNSMKVLKNDMNMADEPYRL
jgi:hypothetical protein